MVKPIKPREMSRVIDDLVHAEARADDELPKPAALPGNHPARLKFWGVRGSGPTPGPATIFYGGNTSCIELRADGEIIILDAGTGIRPLGQELTAEFPDQPVQITLLISHTHWDHIQGFPFFVPAYNSRNRVRILGYEGARKGLETTLSSQMESPYFPIGMRQMPGNITVHELKELEFNIGSIPVKAAFLNHPGICMGYRLNTSVGSISYLPDNEPFQRLRSLLVHRSEEDTIAAMKFATNEDQKIIEFIRESDILIIDAQYDDAEYQTHVGWGHGCVDDIVALALIAKVRRLYLFHHDPDHDDRQVARMVAWARELVDSQGETLVVEAAREGLEIQLPIEETAEYYARAALEAATAGA
jgi:phosphoribosyl 1,2-cyclic phosphodiesterase